MTPSRSFHRPGDGVNTARRLAGTTGSWLWQVLGVSLQRLRACCLSGFHDKPLGMIPFCRQGVKSYWKLFLAMHSRLPAPSFFGGLVGAMSLLLLSAAPSEASLSPIYNLVFSENFDSNNTSFNAVPSGWTNGNSGTLDIIGQCNGGTALFNVFPGNGCYIDLDGSTNSSGLLTKSFSMVGSVYYEMRFDLASNQTNSVNVAIGTTTSQYDLVGTQSFSTKVLRFRPSTSGNYNISFQNQGGDNNGVYLDNVALYSVAPAPLPLLIPFAALSAKRRLQSLSTRLHG